MVISRDQLLLFERFLAELQKWNQRINLTAAETLDELVTRHVVDSLAGLLVLNALPRGAHIADLGSGAGFPGLPMKIARPDLHMTLIEPRQKRAAFLTTVCALLKLQDVTVVEETVGPKRRSTHLAGRFDAVVMRAVAEPRSAKDLALPLVNPGGTVVIWASKQQAEHVDSGFSVRTYRIPETDLIHALLLWRVPT
ncbi:MAG: 16S rRNA (guanine(527)-N(7))-methyltransferase RsmG [Nitrospirota bacterium]